MRLKSLSIKIKNQHGLHMRPAAEVVRIASSYEAEIHLSVADKRASAYSILELLVLGIRKGDMVQVSAFGHDAEDALDALGTFLDSYRDREKISDPHGRGDLDSFAA